VTRHITEIGPLARGLTFFSGVGLATHRLDPWPITDLEPNLNRRAIEARLARGQARPFQKWLKMGGGGVRSH
jgi:hypothetical protein